MIRTISIVDDDYVSEELVKIVEQTKELEAKVIELYTCKYKVDAQNKIANAEGIVVIPINTDEESDVSIKLYITIRT